MRDGDGDVAAEETEDAVGEKPEDAGTGDAIGSGETDPVESTKHGRIDPDEEGGEPGASAAPEQRGPAHSPEEYARLLEALDAGVYVLDSEGTCTFVNDELCALTGYDRADHVGAGPRLVVADETAAEMEAEMVERLKEDRDSFTVSRRLPVHRADGTSVPCEVHVTVLREDCGEILGFVGLLRDVSVRERREQLLARLQETTQSLMQAPSRETVAEIVADAAVERLDFAGCAVRLYDADERTLEPIALADDGGRTAEDLPVLDLDAGPAAAVFTSGEPAVHDRCADDADGEGSDVADAESPDVAEGPFADAAVRATAYHPIGVHGTIALASTAPGGFDDVDRQIAALLATNAAAACNRAKREREVRDAREHVATIVERIEGLVEDTIEVLVGATTREDVERGVCERLAATEPYASAWLARPDVRESLLEPAERAGRGDLSFADARIDLEGEAADGESGVDGGDEGPDRPGAVAYRSGSPEVVGAATLADAEAGWLAAAHANGVRSAVAIPLVHRQASYGVLFVCADERDAFDERELVVLEALGRAVADAIDAIESGRILETDEVVELAVAVQGGTLLDRVAAGTGADLATAGTMSDDGGTLRLFVTAAGADAEDVEAALAGDDAVADASLVADLEAECLFDCALADSVVADLVDRGAVPKRVATEADGTRITVEVPDERAARETFAFLEERVPGATLVGYREHERPVRTRQEFRAALADRFTDRQETALRTAYHGGFFDWPRGADGDELAGSMDIARPTYHQHLRAAQRKVFEQLFEAEAELRE